MAAEREIKIVIRSDGTAAISDLRGVGTELDRVGQRGASFSQEMKAHWAGYAAAWAGYAAAAYAAIKSVEGVWRLAENAMKIEAQLQMLDRLSAKYNTTGTQIAKSLQDASNSVISMDEAVQLATKGIFAGLNPDQLVQLMSITGAAARANAISVSEAYGKIAAAAETGRSRGLRQLGIIVDLEKAHADYAKRLNTTTQDLSEEEKQLASINAILSRQSKIMDELGPAQDNMRTKVLQLKSAWADLKDQVGGVLIAFGHGAVTVFDRLAESMGRSLAQGDVEGLGGIGGTRFPAPIVPPGLLGGRVRGPDWEKLREEYQKIHAANLAREGALVHEALAAEMGMTQEYHDTLRKLDDEEWEREKKLRADIEELDRKHYAAEGELAHDALAAEMGMDKEYFDLRARLLERSLDEEDRLRKRQDEERRIISGEAFTGIGGNDFSFLMERVTNYYTWEAEFKAQNRQLDLEQEQFLQQQKIAMISASYGMMASLAAGFYASSGRQNLAAFRAMQVFQIAQAIMDGHSAVMSSFKWGANIGGPYLGAAMAAIAAAFAMARVQQIASVKPGGGMGSFSAGAAGSGGGAVGTPVTAEPAQEAKVAQVVNVHIYGNVVDHDAFAREIVPSITKAISDGVR